MVQHVSHTSYFFELGLNPLTSLVQFSSHLSKEYHISYNMATITTKNHITS